MIKNKIFASGAERVLTRTDFVDVATGKVMNVYYAGKGYSSEYMLTKNTYYARDQATGATTAATGVKYTLDFPLKFSQSRIVEGIAIINSTHILTLTDGNTSITLYHAILKNTDVLAYKTHTGALSLIGAGSDELQETTALEIPRTKFCPGDELILRVQVTNNTASTGTIYTFYDPMNLEDPDFGCTLPTLMTAIIPFVPEI